LLYTEKSCPLSLSIRQPNATIHGNWKRQIYVVVDDVSDELGLSQLVDTLKPNHNEFGSCSR